MRCPSSVARRLNVSRETLERLEAYVALLLRWNPTINLVSSQSIEDVWTRHILDSAQIADLAPSEFRVWADLGSGGGLPGVVLAAMLADTGQRTFTLVESDKRKATFLRAVFRECDIAGNVDASRIEKAAPLGADVVSARALAPLEALLGHCKRHLKSGGLALLPKGARARAEVAAAQKTWSFSCEYVDSKTQEAAVILKIGDIQRV